MCGMAHGQPEAISNPVRVSSLSISNWRWRRRPSRGSRLTLTTASPSAGTETARMSKTNANFAVKAVRAPMGAGAAALYRLFVEQGHGAVDFSGIIKMLRG